MNETPENGIYAPLTWADNEAPPEKTDTVEAKEELPIFIVEAISMFRMRYAVRARSAEHAMDTVVCEQAEEMSQEHLDEVISSTRQVTEAEYLQMFDADNDYLRSWETEAKLRYIHTVDYKE